MIGVWWQASDKVWIPFSKDGYTESKNTTAGIKLNQLNSKFSFLLLMI